MSGGALTNDRNDLYRLMEWADLVEKENPLLAEQMRDLHRLLDRYDYFMSGDIGNDSIEDAWDEYSDKWIIVNSQETRDLLLDLCREFIDRSVKGHRRDRA